MLTLFQLSSSTASCQRHEFIDAHSSHVSSVSIIHDFHFFSLAKRFIDFKLFCLAATLPGNHNDSSSCSSGPESPNGDGRTQYVSATCVVVTHYSGDVANVVDEHFTRALNFNNDKTSKGKHIAQSAKRFIGNSSHGRWILSLNKFYQTEIKSYVRGSSWKI